MLEQHLTPRTALWAHIAAGVFIGTVAANAATWGATIWSARLAAQEAAVTLSKESARRREQAEQTERERAEQLREKRAQEIQAAEERQRQQAETIAEKERREAAWGRFYRKPPACDEARGGQWTVDCANDYIRARSRFNDQYSGASRPND